MKPNYTPRAIHRKKSKTFQNLLMKLLPKILNIFENLLMDLLPKIFNIFHNMLMDLLPDLRIARSTTPAGGRQGQERSRKNRGGNNNQRLKVSKIENTSGDSKEIQNQSNDCWQLQSLPMGGAAGNWEGTKFEQEFARSVQVGWTGCCNDQFLHVGLVCYDTTIHLICAVYKSMTKYLAEFMASLTSFQFYMDVEFIGLTIDFTSLCWNVSEWNAGWDCPQFRFQL